MPRVSIGLPVYNGENFVGYAVESVISQTFEDWELIISDNGSSDDTVAICKAFADRDPRIKLYVSESNQGAAWNFNEVFRRATGHYFRWLSHDDFLMPTAIEECVAVMDDRPHLAICATVTGALDPNGLRILDNTEEFSDYVCQGITEDSEAQRRLMTASESLATRYQGVLMHSRRCNEIYGLIRRELMAKTQLHPTYCGGEKVLLAELAMHGRIYEVPELLFYVRWHDARFTANSSTREQDEHMATTEKPLFSIPHQYRATLGYLLLVAKIQMSLSERIKCLSVWLRFTLQIRKWKSIIANTLSGKATWAEIEGETKAGERVHKIKDFLCEHDVERASETACCTCESNSHSL